MFMVKRTQELIKKDTPKIIMKLKKKLSLYYKIRFILLLIEKSNENGFVLAY